MEDLDYVAQQNHNMWVIYTPLSLRLQHQSSVKPNVWIADFIWSHLKYINDLSPGKDTYSIRIGAPIRSAPIRRPHSRSHQYHRDSSPSAHHTPHRRSTGMCYRHCAGGDADRRAPPEL